MAQDLETGQLDLMILRAPDEQARQALRERARELGCTLEPLQAARRTDDGGDGAGPPLPGEDGGTPRLEDAAAVCRALLEGTRDEVLVADEDGRITFASRRLASLAGADPGEVAGAPADRILGAIGLPEFSDLRGMLARVSCARTEATLTDPSGNSHPVLLRGVSTPLARGRRRFVWFITELSRVRSVERANRLLRSELETQSRLLALVSHELRTPLHVILGQLSLLQTGLHGDLNDEQQDSVQRSARAGESLLSLINDLIDFARLEAEELELEISDFELRDLLEDVLEMAGSLLEESEREAVIRHEGSSRDVRVRADAERTRQVLMQLLTNALKHSDQGRIVVHTRVVDEPADEPGAELPVDGRMVAVDVRDQGEGIPPKERERVFEPFQQTARLLDRDEEGTGLGLAIARRLARRQGGELTASGSSREGSVFTFYLPAEG